MLHSAPEPVKVPPFRGTLYKSDSVEFACSDYDYILRSLPAREKKNLDLRMSRPRVIAVATVRRGARLITAAVGSVHTWVRGFTTEYHKNTVKKVEGTRPQGKLGFLARLVMESSTRRVIRSLRTIQDRGFVG